MYVPTLIVGLGGTGSAIANSVARLYHDTLDDQLKQRFPSSFMAFDTDINDIHKLTSLERDHIFQTSNRWTVGEYITHYGQRIADWFPVEEKDLYSKSLLEGAGQIRVLSRLAFYNMMQDRLFQQRIGNGVQHLMQLSRGELANLRIYLVGSLCGGTGSGIFTQLAIWFARKFAIHHPVIKGILFMPDIYVHAFGLPANQHVNVKANAFASLKEIEAVLRTQSNLDDRDFELDYDPLSSDKKILRNEEIISMLYLIDYETSSGSSLSRNHEVYEEMVVKGIFNQLFTELGTSQRSVEDNNIITRIQETRASGKIYNYCTFGVAALEYPYEDIVDYLAHQFSIYSVSEKWLAPDSEFAMLQREYRQMVESGAAVSRPPVIAEQYVEILRRYALTAGDSFFRPLFEHYTEKRIDSSGQEVHIDLIDDFLSRTTEFLDQNLRQEHLFSSMYDNYPTLTMNYLQQATSRSDIVHEHDNKLELLRNNLEEPVQAVAASVFRLVGQNGLELPDNELQEYHLHYYIRKGGGANGFPHPVSVRYFLYDLGNRLKSVIRPLESEVRTLRETIRGYNQGFKRTDDKSGAEVTENNEERMNRLEGKGMLGKFFGGELKEFSEAYVHQANNHGRNMKEYVRLKTQLEFYRKLYDQAAELADEYQLFFESLRPTLDSVRNAISELERYHEIRQAGSCTHYILAARTHKQALWEEFRGQISLKTAPEINRQINTLVQDLWQRRQGQRFSLQKAPVMENYKEKFLSLIIPFNQENIKKELGARLNLNIAEAIRKEVESDPTQTAVDAAEAENNYHRRVALLLADLRRRADGYLMYVNPNDKNQMLFFGMNTAVYKSLNNTVPGFSELIKAEAGDSGVTDGFFSPYIIQAYRIHHALHISNIKKFAYPYGDYYQAYRQRTDSLNSAVNWQDQAAARAGTFSNDQFRKKELPEGIIVHIDKNWHKPGLIAELEKSEQQKFESDLCRAALYARIYELMVAKADRQVIVLEYNVPGEERKRKKVPRLHNSEFLHLLDFLADNPGLISRLTDTAGLMQKREKSLHRDEVEEYSLEHRLSDIKEELAQAIIAERGFPDKQKNLFGFFEMLLSLYLDFTLNNVAGDDNAKSDHFTSKVKYFLQHRGLIGQFTEDEYAYFRHACENVLLKVN